jgi:hypothetical protein
VHYYLPWYIDFDQIYQTPEMDLTDMVWRDEDDVVTRGIFLSHVLVSLNAVLPWILLATLNLLFFTLRNTYLCILHSRGMRQGTHWFHLTDSVCP